MTRIAYYRVSTADQSVESQRHAMGGGFDDEFDDIGVSGAVPAAQRPGFAKLLSYIRKGDTLHVYAVDRLGRDALDVQAIAVAQGHSAVQQVFEFAHIASERVAGEGRQCRGRQCGRPSSHGRKTLHPAGSRQISSGRKLKEADENENRTDS